MKLWALFTLEGWQGNIAAMNRELASIPNVILMFLTGTIAPQFEELIWEKLNLQDGPSTTVIQACSTQCLNISYQVISARIKAAFCPGMTEREKDAIKEEWKQ